MRSSQGRQTSLRNVSTMPPVPTFPEREDRSLALLLPDEIEVGLRYLTLPLLPKVATPLMS